MKRGSGTSTKESKAANWMMHEQNANSDTITWINHQCAKFGQVTNHFTIQRQQQV